jgi:hypothetical protein
MNILTKISKNVINVGRNVFKDVYPRLSVIRSMQNWLKIKKIIKSTIKYF